MYVCNNVRTETDAPYFYVISFLSEKCMPPEFQMSTIYTQKDTQVNRPIDSRQIRKHCVREEANQKKY